MWSCCTRETCNEKSCKSTLILKCNFLGVLQVSSTKNLDFENLMSQILHLSNKIAVHKLPKKLMALRVSSESFAKMPVMCDQNQ